MKKIKLLLPVWLLLLYFGSIFYMVQTRTEKRDQYQELVSQAREYASNEVVTDAVATYEQALKVHPNLQLCLETGEMLLEQEDYADANKWYTNHLYANYPDEEQTYLYGIHMSFAKEDYSQAFKIYEECRKRELNTAEIEDLMKPVLYSYVLSGSYEEVQPFGNLSGIAAVKYNENWGYINTDGQRVLDYIYTSAGMFGDVAAVTDQNGETYFVDMNGNKKITDLSVLSKDPELGQVKQFLGIDSGKLWAFNGQYWNCYDAETCEKLFGGYTAVTSITNGICAVQNGTGKWAILSGDGKELTEYKYEAVLTDQKQVFSRTNAVLVKEDGQVWLVDQSGNHISAQSYEDGCAFYDNTCAAVKQNGKWSYVDQEGNEQDLGSYDEAQSFSNGLAAVKMNGKWGYINQNGELVIECQFEQAGPFAASGVAFVKPDADGYWNLLSLYKNNHN